MTALLQVGRCDGLSVAEEAVGGGSKHTCAVTRSGEPADGRETEPVGEKAPDRRSAELAETQARGADRKEERIGRVVRPVADQEGDDRRRGDAAQSDQDGRRREHAPVLAVHAQQPPDRSAAQRSAQRDASPTFTRYRDAAQTPTIPLPTP